MDNKDLLLYWIKQREAIRHHKEAGLLKPWSLDPIFQTTYFCNVRREDDKVTKWIRKFYNPWVGHKMFEYNIVLARFLNWPPTLKAIDFQVQHDPFRLEAELTQLAKKGKIWGNAYVVTTHGIPMSKVAYLCHNVMDGFVAARQGLGAVFVGGPLQGCRGALTAAYNALMGLEGLGSFMAGQVIADLKNTPGHPLQAADDRETFVAAGPGSKRGISWFHHGDCGHPPSFYQFSTTFGAVREFVDIWWDPDTMGPPICNQDLQNCLCEYDKYMRVKHGTGRSKRSYNGN